MPQKIIYPISPALKTEIQKSHHILAYIFQSLLTLWPIVHSNLLQKQPELCMLNNLIFLKLFKYLNIN